MRERLNYLTSADIAQRLGLTPDRIRQIARSGRLRPAFTTAHGTRLFTEDELERYQREHQREMSGVS